MRDVAGREYCAGMTMTARTADWLLESDPALRWQVERDLRGAPDAVWQATRARVATEGLGAALLARQDPDGQWAGGAHFPAGYFDSPEAQQPEQPWTATSWSLSQLREWGLDARHLAGTADKLRSAHWEYEDLPYWHGEVDCCINAWTLANGLWLGADVDGIVQWFLDHQLPDGGWNCEWVEGARVSSFHSTLNALIGLLDYQVMTGDADRVRGARRRGEEYLLSRGLFRRRRDGEPFDVRALSLAHPRRWFYNILAAADYFRAASAADGTEQDPRMGEAIDAIRAERQDDGTWLQGHRLPGRVWFHQDAPPGEPSKWVTLSALRVLAWWDRDRA